MNVAPAHPFALGLGGNLVVGSRSEGSRSALQQVPVARTGAIARKNKGHLAQFMVPVYWASLCMHAFLT